MSLDERIARLEDLREIEQLKYSYAERVDAQDTSALAGLFTPTGRWVSDQLGVDYRGRDEIQRYFAHDVPHLPRVVEDALDFIPWARHFMTNPRIALAQDRHSAVGRFYMLGLQTARRSDDPSDERAVFLTINYEDRFLKQDGRWYFEEIRAIQHHTSDWAKGWIDDAWRGGRIGASPWIQTEVAGTDG